ncbi:M56 family metallopeptidase [Myroides injenensis]|uniref:M56 family metallopeptidase n=2 Tax=Myroides injenensis TaxID=1183151 RepID=UPI0004748F09|nr:M56 family metallopeptidase [Myroides injenensis]
MRKETFVKTNRLYFLGGILGSFLIPLITFTKVVYVPETKVNFNDIMLLAEETQSDVTTSTLWSRMTVDEVVFFIYILIASIALIWFFTKYIRLRKHLKSLPVSNLLPNILIDETTNDPYSFWNKIVLPLNYKNINRLDLIIQHENIHIVQKHSIDLLLIEFLKHLFWFNPLLILMQRAMNLNLEYIVDKEVSELVDTYDYQRALVEFEYDKVIPYNMVNTFSNSDLKKRVLMLNNQQSTIMKKMKFLLLSPFIALFVFFLQIEVKAQEIASNQEREDDTIVVDYPGITKKDMEQSTITKDEASDYKSENELSKEVELKRKELENKQAELKVKRELHRKELENKQAELKVKKELHRKELENKQAELKAERDLYRQEVEAKIESKRNEIKERNNALVQEKNTKIAEEIRERNRKLNEESAARRVENEKRLREIDLNRIRRGQASFEEERKKSNADFLKNTKIYLQGKFYTLEDIEVKNISPKDLKKVIIYNKSQSQEKFNTDGSIRVIEYILRGEDEQIDSSEPNIIINGNKNESDRVIKAEKVKFDNDSAVINN